MPLYKVWRDLRSRFVFILIALMIVSALTVFYNARSETVIFEAKNFHEAAVRTFRGTLFVFWCFGVVFLGLGGLSRERAVGTIDYTLSLPISRTRWFWYRACLGGLLSLLVAVTSTAIVPVFAFVFGGEYPLSAALLHGLRLGLGGMLFYAIGLALSCISSGEYLSVGGAIASVFVVNFGTRVIEPIGWLNIQDAILPMSMIDRATYLPRGPLPWNGIGLSLIISLILALIAWRATLWRDF
jgi:ABC-type transport system involved in multi-copper enzyme maturation permease subunit